MLGSASWAPSHSTRVTAFSSSSLNRSRFLSFLTFNHAISLYASNSCIVGSHWRILSSPVPWVRFLSYGHPRTLPDLPLGMLLCKLLIHFPYWTVNSCGWSEGLCLVCCCIPSAWHPVMLCKLVLNPWTLCQYEN